MRKPILVFPKIYTESFAIVSREKASHENYQSASEAISRETLQEAYPRNEWFSVFKSHTVTIFQITIFCLICASLNPKHSFTQISPKTQEQSFLKLI